MEAFCYDINMQNPNEDKMPDPLDFVPGQKMEPIPTDANSTLYATPQQRAPKKGGVARNVLTTILLIPIIIVGIIIATIFGFSVSHGNELNKLKQETTSVFSSSNFAPGTYDCHDVELRNECSFVLSNSEAAVGTYLLSHGFSVDNTYGKGYKKGSLYIDSNSKGSYSSFYVK
ncbi:MAG: hypothetical protein JWM52_302 [Candidatus Saccharibacteria bacterium]|nr:hypothetical protein [Candidatus Saccharibacteria bacterium]